MWTWFRYAVQALTDKMKFFFKKTVFKHNCHLCFLYVSCPDYIVSWFFVTKKKRANRWCAFFSKNFLNNRKCCKNIKLTFWSQKDNTMRWVSACTQNFYGTISNVMFTTPATITLLRLPPIKGPVIKWKLSSSNSLVSLNLCQLHLWYFLLFQIRFLSKRLC